MAKKYYAVWRGRTIGIFDSWEACKEQIDHYANAGFKSFNTLEAAEDALKQHGIRRTAHNVTNAETRSCEKGYRPVLDSIAVDAACSGNPGVMEYRGVYTKTGKQLFKAGPFERGTNNIGEFLAIVDALEYLEKQGKGCPVYSDSSVAISWVGKKSCGTKLPLDEDNTLGGLIERAVEKLRTRSYRNKILKWDTKRWGEIPADFNRK
ncbi:MAG: ribonuclease H family protein [Spirochaetales bacterium]|nr:ribonuclease H family protein [Spirochaetales bacterium]